MVGAAKPEGGKSVKSAERVLDLLETIGTKGQGVTFSGLSQELGIPKSSLHALLEVLQSRSYIDLDPETRRYRLGIRVWETGQAYQRHHNVIEAAQTVLQSIVDAVNETAQLAKLVGHENVYLAKVDSTHALRLQSEVGTRLSAHATGVGKVLLAQFDDDEIALRFGRSTVPVYTRNTSPTVAALIDELEVIRARGFAIDNEEYTPGVFCLAVPVYDAGETATTALSVSVPVTRATVRDLGFVLARLADGALQLGRSSGGRYVDPQLRALCDATNARKAVQDVVNSGRYALGFDATL